MDVTQVIDVLKQLDYDNISRSRCSGVGTVPDAPKVFLISETGEFFEPDFELDPDLGIIIKPKNT